MWNERVYVYDRQGNPVQDLAGDLNYASRISYETMLKGYGPASFTIHRDIARNWLVKNAYRVIIKDGLETVYEGRINDPQNSLGGQGETVTVPLSGFYAILKERHINKWWADNDPFPIMRVPDGTYAADVRSNDDQNQFQVTKKDGEYHVVAGFGDVTRPANDDYQEEYVMPLGSYIRRFIGTVTGRSGEGMTGTLYNLDQTAVEFSQIVTTGATPVDYTLGGDLTQGDTRTMLVIVGCNSNDIYDQNDWVKFFEFMAYAKMDSFSSPNLYADEIIQDCLEIKCPDLSADYSQLASPSYAISPFTTRNRDYEDLDSVIARALGYGDASYNTYDFQVWDSSQSSDGLPQCYIRQRPGTSDYEWQLFLEDCDTFNLAESDDRLFNYIIVRYSDQDGHTWWVIPDDDASLKDTTSIVAYGQREKFLDAGQCSSSVAIDYGVRFLTLYSEPQYKGSFSVTGQIRNKQGVWLPANRVKAGERVRLMDYQGGVTLVIGYTQVDADSQSLTMEPAIPPDSLAVWLAQRELL